MDDIARLEAQLNDFDAGNRAAALKGLRALAQRGVIELAADTGVVNMHCHTFFSFNAYGHSPTSLAWMAKRRGYRLMGIVDFDVLKGVDEFLNACEALAVRGTAGLETRIFLPEYGTQEINSPGEPGVCYHMGVGFASSQVPASVRAILADLKERASVRNQAILARVNDYLSPASIDYERDVLPLSPAGNPTERHMVVAYIQAAERTIPNPLAFWADRLHLPQDHMTEVMADAPKFQNLIRAKLMKRGGVGYVEPESGMFPTLDSFHQLVESCGALPCAAWLDGISATERDIEDWLGFLTSKGVIVLNIIPDRNWNIADPQARELKVNNLYRVVEVAQRMALPLNIGTEMNSFGQKLVDDFDAAELAPLREPFINGAYFVYGHTMMQRALGLGYQSKWAKTHLPGRRERNSFFQRMGTRIRPGIEGLRQLRALSSTVSPEEMVATIRGQQREENDHGR